MKTYIILFRAINVGGKNILPMKALKSLLESNGFGGVQTYIQTGNVVVQYHEDPTGIVTQLVEDTFGLKTKIIVLEPDTYLTIVASNPYPNFEGKFVHFYFLDTLPTPDVERIDKLKTETERYSIIGKVCYLHAPDGIGRSKLVAKLESCLGVTSTARNLNTVNRITTMIK